MTWLWIFLSLLVAVAGLRYWARMRSARTTSRPPRVDDDALRQILATGSIRADEEDESLDMDAAARAEEEFWSESWDEPEEYGR